MRRWNAKREGDGAVGTGRTPYRLWIVTLTSTYTNDLLASMVKVGFMVAADDPSTDGPSGSVFSCRLGIHPASRLTNVVDANGKRVEDAAHQCDAIRMAVCNLLDREKMKIHAVVVVECDRAAWSAGNVDLQAEVESYRKTFS